MNQGTMNTAASIDIDKLPPAEKLALIERLWESLARTPSDVPVPAWHERVLAERLANPDPKSALDLDEAMSQIKQEFDARRTTA
ncbi:hypothetical protein Psta_1507 [Pirellula staleyi DSM 6068]|uniref:Addiction module component, TIGR02574 family n=1 Tax=Pirellula staleyi (strain ATCC 27377 / DSM 6068 / ICPB 4128) TaxID=530564 RepID=D2QXJ7_PIRSD|nr:addiction module protein [Pirellula staleyi]ADB16182.1 hypothetical protein Psta_1507 [Pirellula staleyi DSM 6068]